MSKAYKVVPRTGDVQTNVQAPNPEVSEKPADPEAGSTH